MLDAPFVDRGARADDAMRALRAALTDDVPAYDGEYFSFQGMVLDPRPVQARVPLWVGGRTARSLRRAVELGDGWCPFWLSTDAAAAMLAEHDVPERFEIVLQTNRPLDPSTKADEARAAVDALVAAGATTLSLKFVHHSVDHYIEQLEAMVRLLGK